MKGLPPISSSSSQDSFFPSDGIWSCIEEREKEACCWLAHEWSSSIFKGLSLVLARKSVVTECKKWKRERRIISKDFFFLFCCLPWVNLTLAVCRSKISSQYLGPLKRQTPPPLPSSPSSISVTIFGEFLQLWQKFTSLWQIVDSLFLIWQNYESTLSNLRHYWANFQCCKWPNIEK